MITLPYTITNNSNITPLFLFLAYFSEFRDTGILLSGTHELSFFNCYDWTEQYNNQKISFKLETLSSCEIKSHNEH